MEPTDYDGPGRREDKIIRTQFEKAVETAAQRAAQTVAQIHRRRLVTHAFIAGIVASALISIPVVFTVTGSEQATTHANALYNCRLLTTVSHDMSQFVSSDAQLRISQAHSQVNVKLFRDLGHFLPLRDLTAAATQGNQQTISVAHTWQHIAANLAGLGATDCSQHLPAG